MQNPGVVKLNNHRLKTQRWQHEGEVIDFTTVIRGEHLGLDVVREVQSGPVTLVADDTIFTGTAQVTDERKSGEGSTAVYRIGIRIKTDRADSESEPLTTDEKLDLILSELTAIRRELANARLRNAPDSEGLAAPSGASTLLDFDIES